VTDLLNVDTALEKILSQISTLNHEQVSLTESLGRVIAQDIASPIDLPSFDNSAMDGYAIHFEDSHNASELTPISLSVIMDIPAGKTPTDPLNAGQAARIMTGAPIPQGATAVVPVEHTSDDWEKGDSPPLPKSVNILIPSHDGANIRRIGENIQIGGTVITVGTIIGPAEIGMLAGIGCTDITVTRKPKVIILTTGNELVDIDQPLTSGKIRDTNSYTLASLIELAGGIPIRLPIANDSMDSIRNLYAEAIQHNPDMIISSAGVSVGTADLVKVVMQELGNIDFWRINLRPGKPLAYGTIQNIPFFGLPGNPVSAMITFEVFVRPSLAKMAGLPHHPNLVKATTAENMTSDGRRSYNRVTLERNNDTLIAKSTGTQSSGALMSMVLADGLIIIPEDMTFVPTGTELSVLLLRPVS
jgi:molybdopterin molybdotransferase